MTHCATPACEPYSRPAGGKGAYRIAAGLDFEAARADPKPIVGFSDITYLHLALHRFGAPIGFQGPFVNWNDDYCDADCAEALRRALMEPDPVVVLSNATEYTARFTMGTPATGTLIGGHFETTETNGWTLGHVMSDWLAGLGVPVLGGLPLGHGRNPDTVPFGSATTIDPSLGTMTVTPGVH